MCVFCNDYAFGINLSSISEGKTFDKTTSPIELGNMLYVGGSGPGNFSRIQDAIDNASVGDTVFVYDDPAPYNENLIVNKTLHLIGENKETTIINGDSAGNVIVILAEMVSVSGFTIQMTGIDEGNSGINIRANSSVISDNILVNNDCCQSSGRCKVIVK